MLLEVVYFVFYSWYTVSYNEENLRVVTKMATYGFS